MIDLDRLSAAYRQVKGELLAERTPDGHWVGELSSSALATATAVSALAMVRRIGWDKAAAAVGPPSRRQLADGGHTLADSLVPLYELDDLILRGVAWLIRHQNADGGFGDTDLSHSNIATTMLVVAALHLAGVADEHAGLIQRANTYIDAKGRLRGLRERYGIDKTFVVPIMTNLALAGLVDWREVDPLPFELACVPQALYRFVSMPVVSYAIPALVAIGQARYFHAPPRNPCTRFTRSLCVTRSLKVLRRMQPDSGGYLEATPLTSFVVMSLASASSRHAPRDEPTAPSMPAAQGLITRSVMATVADEVIREGVKFLFASIRPDGSWPIDTNLATWNTTLAINALAGAGEDVAELLGPKCLDWLLSCQHTKRHPFTGANPGGFGWSDLSGAVPDADDTPGAILALCNWPADRWHAWGFARNWLRDLRNSDGGWPTFCRGWGRLPFDRSGTDLTAHVIRAFRELGGPNDALWVGKAHGYFRRLYASAVNRGFQYLGRTQHPDGFWSPLWFGNQDHPTEDNPVYGTAKVLMAYRDLGLMDSPEARRGVAWLVANQNADGGWGSGVWGKVRSTECVVRNEGVRAERLGSDGVESLGEPVLSTQYSVLSTSADSRHEIPPLQSQIPNLKSSIEETALAVEALLAICPPSPQPPGPSPATAAVARGLNWLLDRVEQNQHRQPAPIGFYFAKLWYYERLYPLTFTVAALGRACRQFARPAPASEIATPAPDIPAPIAASDAP
jgi:squalene-hopene/tetraprenyl-beta-curcumene cyclase